MISLYQYGNCGSDLKGSGLPLCDIPLFGDLQGFAIMNKNTKWTVATDDLTLADWKTKMKSLSIFPYSPLYQFTQNTPENERATSSTGLLSIIRNGKPFFSVSFDRGSTLHKSLYDKRGNSRWKIGLLFEKGLLLETNQTETELTGFNCSLFDVETYKFLQGTDPEMAMAVFQLSNADTFNRNHIFFSWEELGFNLLDVNGVIDSNIVVNAISAGTTFTAKVTSNANRGYSISSLALANFVLGGTQASSTTVSGVAYNATSELYTFTVSPALIATDTVSVTLGASGGVVVAENSIGELFKGTSNTVTVS